jgi:hypothetical protein
MALPYAPELVLVAPEALWEACRVSVPKQCRDGSCRIDGCQLGRKIFLANDLAPERQTIALTHEYGHLLRPDGTHATEGCPEHTAGPNVMCPFGSESAEPTAADFDWVLAR